MKSLLNQVLEDSSLIVEDNFFSASVEIICTHHRSLDIPKHSGSISSVELFIVKEKLVTRNYSKITSRMIQCTASSLSGEGL
jgi:hypothetical protein